MALVEVPDQSLSTSLYGNFVWAVAGQTLVFNGLGMTDPILYSNVSALVPFKYSTVFVPANDIGTPAAPLPNTEGGNYLLGGAAGVTPLIAFEDGVGDVGTSEGIWYVLTYAETDANKGGRIVDLNYYFLAVGLAVMTRMPVQRGGTGAAVTDPQFRSTWLRADFGYAADFVDAVTHGVYLQLTFGSTPLSYILGTPAMFPFFGGTAGDRVSRNGVVAVVGSFVPFTAALVLGGRDDSRQPFINVFPPSPGIVVQNDVAKPTNQGALTVPSLSINTSGNLTVYVPLVIIFIGHFVCLPDLMFCGMPFGVGAVAVQGVAPFPVVQQGMPGQFAGGLAGAAGPQFAQPMAAPGQPVQVLAQQPAGYAQLPPGYVYPQR